MVARRRWIIDPHSGGRPVPVSVQEIVARRLNAHALEHYPGKYQKLDISFRGKFCYAGFFRPVPPPGYQPFRMSREEYLEHIATHPVKMVRLRYFDLERWSCAFYTYSDEVYKPCLLRTGEWFGRMEECFDIGATYME